MKTVCIRKINGSAIHKQAMSLNSVSKEDRSTSATRNMHHRVVFQKTEEDRNAKPATLITDESKGSREQSSQ